MYLKCHEITWEINMLETSSLIFGLMFTIMIGLLLVILITIVKINKSKNLEFDFKFKKVLLLLLYGIYLQYYAL